MSNTAIILTHIGQELNDCVKRKIKTAVDMAIEKYNVTDFYFFNEDMDDCAENEYMKSVFQKRGELDKFAVDCIKAYAEAHGGVSVHTAMVAARTVDTNYDKSIYDEVIQVYPLYYKELESEEMHDAYQMRDSFLGAQVDYVFWCSNRILATECTIPTTSDKLIIID